MLDQRHPVTPTNYLLTPAIHGCFKISSAVIRLFRSKSKNCDASAGTQPGNSSTFISDEMHLTIRFVSKYFAPLGAYERNVHIPSTATGRFTRFETNAKKRGKD
ncbi:hypothetical protein QC762_608047 [Podospora pseudocomata]|uniref:Uncharacterized protein n=1 Tax=Podospora pseudocomata TaxID=2093779 RepID=A0ABR0G8H6_9PEZI|nr:hypothetical protein QC762_608047 [Podospora pseudocomata]